MPVPTSINDLSTTAASNSPSGSDSPATLDDYDRAHASFIAIIRDAVSPLISGSVNTAADIRTLLDVYSKAESVSPGDIKWQASPTIDAGWLAANGAAVSRTTYSALFSRIGTTWGAGDGSTTFNLPDLRDRMAIGSGNLYALGAAGGSKDAIVVSHTHGINDPGHNHSINLGLDVASGTGYQKLLPGDGYSESTSGSGTGISIQSTGSSGTNANLPPYRALLAVIKY